MKKEDIKKARESLGMTQAGFAYALGTSCTSVNRWENGKCKISKVWIQQIKRVEKKFEN